MKTNFLLFLVLSLFIVACNPDEEIIVECEPFKDEGTVAPSFAISQLPSDYFDRTAPLIFINDNMDSMTFIAESKIQFTSDRIVTTLCENGDSTRHVYNATFVSKSFDAGPVRLSISANINFGFDIMFELDGTQTLEEENCPLESLTTNLLFDSFIPATSFSQRFNPQNCSELFSGNSNFTLEPNLLLNNQTYSDVLVSNDTIFNQPVVNKLYFQNAKGFIAFEDESEVLWTLQE